MNEELEKVRRETQALVEEYRDQCFWFNRQDYLPHEPDELIRALDQIQRYGDLKGFRRAGEIKKWLSHHYSATSAE
jgi:hypothetical protein